MAAGGGPPPEDVPPGDVSEDGSPAVGSEAGSRYDASRGRDRTSMVRRGARTNTHGSAASGRCARVLRSDPVREACPSSADAGTDETVDDPVACPWHGTFVPSKRKPTSTNTIGALSSGLLKTRLVRKRPRVGVIATCSYRHSQRPTDACLAGFRRPDRHAGLPYEATGRPKTVRHPPEISRGSHRLVDIHQIIQVQRHGLRLGTEPVL